MVLSLHPKLVSICWVLIASTGIVRANELVMKPEVHAFLQDYCISCHGPEKSKGDRVFHTLFQQKNDKVTVEINDENELVLREILDQLNLGEMPPEKKNVKQPKYALSKSVVAWLTSTLSRLDEHNEPQVAILRRLNKAEYTNTMEDLLGLKGLSYDPCRDFPADDSKHGFINLGHEQNTTDVHLDYWLKAADQYLDLAFQFGKKEPVRKTVIHPEEWGYPEVIKDTVWMYRKLTKGKYVDIGSGKIPLTDHLHMISAPRTLVRRGGVPKSGYYRFKINMEAVRRLTHPYDPKMIPADLSQPMRLGFYMAHNRQGLTDGGGLYRKRLVVWDLKDHQQQDYEVVAWVNKGFIPFVNWENGPGSTDWWMRDICAKYHTDIEFRGKEGAAAWHIIGKDLVPGRTISDVWKGPLVRIHQFSFEGPLPETYHNKTHQKFFAGSHDINQVNIKSALKLFMSEAYRRTILDEEVDTYYILAQDAMSKLGYDREKAIRSAFKAVLVSPDFLYHHNGVPEKKRLEQVALANRLAYTLWSSKPDQELIQISQQGKLEDQKVLRGQVQRMLNDPRSKSFIDGFSSSWLRLDKLGTMPPSRAKYLNYYIDGLEDSMKQETLLFVEDHLKRNLPLTNFLDSKTTYLNAVLARHYGIDGVDGSHFRKVNLTNREERGGLLGQASILTLTANGVETSPVTRGIWILESILGTPPPPPPPDVEPLDPDIRGAVTLKQRLKKHREVESCADCHQKIDPYGFPLEQFDPIGGFRKTYAKHIRWSRQTRERHKVHGRQVDATSELGSGEKLNGLESLRSMLLSRKGQFAKMLTEKLLVYSTGREMTYKDHATLERLANLKPADQYGFRELVVNVLCSDLVKKR